MSENNTPKVDPFAQRVAQSMQVVIDEEGKVKPIPPAPPARPIENLIKASRPLSEIVDMPRPADPPPKPPDKPPEKPPDKPPEKPEVPDKEKVEVKPSSADELQRKLDALKQVPAEPPPKEPPKPAALEPADEEYIKSLGEDHQEEIALARFAESRGQTGQVKKLVDYFRAVDQYAQEHPDNPPGSEPFNDFVEQKRPKYPNRKKLEREWITEQAKAESQKEFTEQQRQLQQQLRQMQMTPQIESLVDDCLKMAPELPEGSQPISQEVIAEILAGNYDKYPIEAPIVLGMRETAKTYLRITHGLEKWDPQNPRHAYIGQFLAKQEQRLLAEPSDKRLWKGKPFVSWAEYDRLQREQPDRARDVEIFRDDDMLRFFNRQFHMDMDAETKRLIKAGFIRQAERPSPPPATTPSSPPAAPKAGSSSMPPPGGPPPPSAEQLAAAQFIDNLVPGASKAMT